MTDQQNPIGGSSTQDTMTAPQNPIRESRGLRLHICFTDPKRSVKSADRYGNILWPLRKESRSNLVQVTFGLLRERKKKNTLHTGPGFKSAVVFDSVLPVVL